MAVALCHWHGNLAHEFSSNFFVPQSTLIQDGECKITIDAKSSDGKLSRKETIVLNAMNIHTEESRSFGLELMAIISPLIMQDCNNMSTTEVALKDEGMKLNAEQLVTFAISDNRYLGKALWSLVKGDVPMDRPCSLDHVEKVKCDPSMLANLMCVFIATEMLTRLFRPGPGILALVIANLMDTMNVRTEFKAFMSRIRLSASRSTMERQSEKTVFEKLREGVQIQKDSLFGWFADNIGFKYYGNKEKKGGYSQHILMQLLRVPATALRNVGVYGANALSRARTKWTERRATLSPKDFMPDDNDYETHSVRWLSFLDLSLKAKPLAPTVDEARQRLQDEQYYCDERAPSDIGMHCQDVIRTKDAVMADRLLAEPVDDEGVEDADDIYEKNYITTDNPINNSLSKKAVVNDMMDGAQRVLNDVIESGDDDMDISDIAAQIPISKDFGTFFATDGDPAIQGIRIIRTSENEYNVMWRAGGFHYLLKAHHGCGNTFGDTHFGWLVQTYRRSDKQRDWVLLPSDPNQADDEIPQILLACAISLINEYEERNEVTEASAEEIHDFFVELAKEKKHVFSMLMHMLWENVLLMIRDSESDGKKGNPELFFTALRFMLPFATINNNGGYVELGLDWEMWRRTSSEADMKIYKEFIFSKLTVNGKSIFGDRFVEWSVRDHRKHMGKHYRVGHTKLLRKLSLTMTTTLRGRNPMKGIKKEAGTIDEAADMEIRTTDFGFVFCKVLVALKDSNFFGVGPLKDKNGNNLPEGSTPDGKHIYSDNWLYLFSIAEQRTLAVVNERCFGAERTLGPHPFTRPARFAEEDKESAAAQRSIITTLDPDVLNNGATNDFLKAEYKWMKATDARTREGFPSAFGTNKPQHIAAVVKARRILLEMDPNALENRANSMLETREGQPSDLETQTFYKLTESARSCFRTKRSLSRIVAVPDDPTTIQPTQDSSLTGSMHEYEMADSQSTIQSPSAAARDDGRSPSKRAKVAFDLESIAEGKEDNSD